MGQRSRAEDKEGDGDALWSAVDPQPTLTAGDNEEMTGSLATQLMHSDFDVPCPACSYPVWIRWSEAVVQTAVLCPCCRIRIWLIDTNGGMQTVGDVIERQFDEALKGLYG